MRPGLLLEAASGLAIAIAGLLITWGMYRQRMRDLERSQEKQARKQDAQEKEIESLKITSARHLGYVEQMQSQLKTVGEIYKFLIERPR